MYAYWRVHSANRKPRSVNKSCVQNIARTWESRSTWQGAGGIMSK